MVYCYGFANITMPAISAIAVETTEQIKNKTAMIRCYEIAQQLSSFLYKSAV